MRITVPFVYGASDRSADEERPLIEAGLARRGIQAELRPIDWGRAHGVDVRPSDLEWIVTRRFRQGRTAAERRAMARVDAVLEQAGAGEPVEIRPGPGWSIERTLLRWVYGQVLTVGTLAVMVDVLSYLRRPDEIIGYVSAELDAARAEADGRPVVALGLSLGGIILVDTLAKRIATPGAVGGSAPTAGDPTEAGPIAGPPADLLVTVGSQSPFLLACDALGELRRSGPRPLRPFVPWLNVWNPDDFLSFPAGPIFGDAVRPRAALRDVIGTDGATFPAVHSHYWQDETTYQAIATMLADLAAGRFGRR
jgi:hypothetical protein